MSFKQEIHDVVYARLTTGLPASTSGDVLNSLDSEAWDIANGVANTQHGLLVQGIENLCTAVSSLTEALSTWVPGVVDAGGPGKGIVVSAANALGVAANALKTLGGTYRGN